MQHKSLPALHGRYQHWSLPARVATSTGRYKRSGIPAQVATSTGRYQHWSLYQAAPTSSFRCRCRSLLHEHRWLVAASPALLFSTTTHTGHTSPVTRHRSLVTGPYPLRWPERRVRSSWSVERSASDGHTQVRDWWWALPVSRHIADRPRISLDR